MDTLQVQPWPGTVAYRETMRPSPRAGSIWYRGREWPLGIDRFMYGPQPQVAREEELEEGGYEEGEFILLIVFTICF